MPEVAETSYRVWTDIWLALKPALRELEARRATVPPVLQDLALAATANCRPVPGRRLYFITADMCQIVEEGIADRLPGGMPDEGQLDDFVIDEWPVLVFERPIKPYTEREPFSILAMDVVVQGTRGGIVSTFTGFDADGEHTHSGGRAAFFAADIIRDLITNQEIAEAADVTATDASKKKARRARRESATVRIIDLKRRAKAKAKQVTEARRLHMHRWIVRGHWRNQACGPGMQDHRRIYVQAYVKGPDGAPLLEGAKVYKW